MSDWVKKGYYLDFEAISPRFRPKPDVRFYFVKRQRLTEIEAISTTVKAGDEAKIDFGEAPYTNKLKPASKDMVFQCAFGIWPNVQVWLEHPRDYSMRKLPEELPGENWRVGVVTMRESSYYEPNLEATEFWIVYNLHTPVFHIRNPYDKDVTAYLRILVNILVVEPVTDATLIRQLERRIKPSTPVYLKVVEEGSRGCREWLGLGRRSTR